MPNPSKMQQRYQNQAPYERFDLVGEQHLSDAELLAIILRSGSGNADALETAQTLLAMNGNSLASLARMPVHELIRVPGIGRVKARQLRALFELSNRTSAMRRRNNIRLESSRSIADYFMEMMRHESKESLRALFFDIQHNLLREEVLSVGTINSTMFSPREIICAAAACNASSYVLLHNHPSGDPTPSREDIDATCRLVKSGQVTGIPIRDHIIIGDGIYYSFSESGQLTEGEDK